MKTDPHKNVTIVAKDKFLHNTRVTTSKINKQKDK